MKALLVKMSIKILPVCSRNLSHGHGHKNITGSQHGRTKSTINHVSKDDHNHIITMQTAVLTPKVLHQLMEKSSMQTETVLYMFNSNQYVTTLRLTHKPKQHSGPTPQGDELCCIRDQDGE